MRKAKSVTIDGYKYEISKLRTRDQYKIFTKLVKMVAPALKGIGAGKNIMNVDTSEFKDALDIGSLIGALTESHDEDESFAMITTLLGKVVHFDSEIEDEEGTKTVKGVGSLVTSDINKIDVHFEDDLFRMFKLVGQCIQYNYGGFISKLGKSVKGKEKDLQTVEEKPEHRSY